jgi:hypothetical protein
MEQVLCHHRGADEEVQAHADGKILRNAIEKLGGASTQRTIAATYILRFR